MEDIGLYIAYAMFSAALLGAIVWPLINSLKQPKTLVKSGLGVAVLVVLFLISYALSGSEVTAKYAAQGINETSSQIVGAGLTLFYLIFALAILGIIYSEINKALK
ncbi:MAG: hypothetical protein HC811_10495 [Flammeovirgaceae bacterium]|nr:hypothetical protein [Flammeovirgaceae bacterium]